MPLETLSPVPDSIIAHIALMPEQTLGKTVRIHSKQNGIPELEELQLAIIGVGEDRGAIDNVGTGKDLDDLRKALYELFPGNWYANIADLGNLLPGNTEQDTFHALQEICVLLIKKNIVPIIIGGSQNLTYANYRAYDHLEQTVNLTVVDSKFDLGNIDDELTSESYLSKIVMETPANLFNYSNIGYQTYFNSQEVLDLIERLNFDAYRLGEVAQDLKVVEPILRDADIVSIDMGAVRRAEAPANNNAVPNGFYGEQICAIARYAGISDKVSSFGLYEYNAKYDKKAQTAHLMAQMIWYFIEGYNFRLNEYPFGSKKDYTKYIVPIEDTTINFYKSNKSNRWWMDVEIKSNNSTKRTLVPCTVKDYHSAGNQVIPDRWYKTFRKLN